MDNDVCPLLGLVDEQGAYLTYPSYENRCYASRSPQSIPLNEQTFFCLGGHQARCPRFQSRQALMQTPSGQPADFSAPDAAGAGAISSDDELLWQEDPDLAATPEADDEATDWQDNSAVGGWITPAAAPEVPATVAESRPRRPVWPLLLAAGTLVIALMACGVLSAGLLGWRALSSQLALQPSVTPAGQMVVTATPLVPGAALTPGANTAVFTTTATLQAFEVVATAQAAAATATEIALEQLLVTATFTPEPGSITETPFFDQSTMTPTWTPFPEDTPTPFETPTPRDTATPYPTNTPYTQSATDTPQPVAATPTTASAIEPFSATFTVSPTSIEYGASATLNWAVRGVKAMYINGEAISGPTGTKLVSPKSTTSYVLRMLMPDNSVREESVTVTVSVPTATSTPTVTPTPTATPYINMTFAHDLSLTTVSGQDSACRLNNGCTLFQVQVRNVGNRPADYTLSKTQIVPSGWGVFFCWGTDCEFGDTPPAKTLAAGARDTISINYRLPSVLNNGEVAIVTVSGSCATCASPPFQRYSNTFQVTVVLPTSTPAPTATPTPTRTN
ncbi:MAG: hypothetical protein ABTQ73_08305 [Caldilineales bacterium]